MYQVPLKSKKTENSTASRPNVGTGKHNDGLLLGLLGRRAALGAGAAAARDLTTRGHPIPDTGKPSVTAFPSSGRARPTNLASSSGTNTPQGDVDTPCTVAPSETCTDHLLTPINRVTGIWLALELVDTGA
jgi:hypothetical protein